MNCNGEYWLVTAVVRDRPVNSDIQIDALMSSDFSKVKGWLTDISVFTFILFKNKPDLKKFESKLDVLSSKSIKPEWSAAGAANYTLQISARANEKCTFQPGKTRGYAKRE